MLSLDLDDPDVLAWAFVSGQYAALEASHATNPKEKQMHLNPYLIFNGNAEEALEHYRSAIGGEVEIVRVAGSPAADHFPPDWGNKVLHGVLRSPAGVIMVSDAKDENAGAPGDNVSIAIQVDNESEADAIFSKLVVGGNVTMPLEKTFWSTKFGMLTDKFGVNWMVNYVA